ncbi:hypothetical protein D9M68_779370 [compost metagenome]
MLCIGLLYTCWHIRVPLRGGLVGVASGLRRSHDNSTRLNPGETPSLLELKLDVMVFLVYRWYIAESEPSFLLTKLKLIDSAKYKAADSLLQQIIFF